MAAPLNTQKIPPVPSSMDLQEGQKKVVSQPWQQWFNQLRDKVNVITASIVSLAGNSAAGFLSSDGAGGINARKLTAGTNVTITNGDGVLGNPVISASGGGGSSVPYVAALVPLSTSFTILGSTPSLTLYDRVGRLIIEVPSAASRPRCLLQTLPTPPYTIDIGGDVLGTLSTTNDAYALSVGLSDGTKIQSLSFAFFNNSIKYSIDNWTNTTTYSSTLFSEISYNCTLPIFLRLTSDGTTNKLYSSFNGLDFVLIYSFPYATFLTPTLGGIEVYNNSARSITSVVEIFRFVITNSILGDAP